jgi:hypothetical protein
VKQPPGRAHNASTSPRVPGTTTIGSQPGPGGVRFLEHLSPSEAVQNAHLIPVVVTPVTRVLANGGDSGRLHAR